MTNYYDIYNIPDNAPELPEQQGTKTKYWIHDEYRHLLFKIGRENTGENWSEKVASELCSLLGLPHANYDFAVWMGEKGVITENIVPSGGRLVMGNELLSEVHTTYPKDNRYGVQDHTSGRISTLLNDKRIALPKDWVSPSHAINNALDVFLGYLLLDTWIANQDRHHENWGVIRCNKLIYLAPTYDHAASMGQNESDTKREELLTTKDKGRHISHYVTKARSAIYATKSDIKPLLTIEAFQRLANKRPEAAQFWLKQLGDICPQACQTIFLKIPKTEISEVAIKFAMELLALNKQRLLEVTP